MGNFVKAFNDGQKGSSVGIPFGEGLDSLSRAINGFQTGKIYSIASLPKTGKTTFINYAFLLEPYMYAREHNLKIKWYYYSLEMSRILLEFFSVAYFLKKLYNASKVKIEGKVYNIDPELLMGRKVDENYNVIKLPKELKDIVFKIYREYIIDIFGEYDEKGLLIKPGKVTVIERADNPTGIYKYLIEEMDKKGKIIKEKAGPGERIASYIPNDEKEITIVLLDHIRKIKEERQWNKKQTIDKMIEYEVILRNVFGISFVNVIHLNRGITDLQRYKQFGDLLFPSSETVKDSGNISEDSDYLITMFNPNDDKFNLTEHFGLKIKDEANNILYPDLRTLHLVESRHTYFPQHFRVNMKGGTKTFEKFKEQ